MIKALVPKQLKFSESNLYMFSYSVDGLPWPVASLDLLRFNDVRQQSICRIWDSDHLITEKALPFKILRQDWNQQMQFTKPFHASLYKTPIWVIQSTSLTSLVSLHAQEACLACWLFLLFAYNLLQPSIDSGAFGQKLQKSLAKVNTQSTSQHQVWQSQAPPPSIFFWQINQTALLWATAAESPEISWHEAWCANDCIRFTFNSLLCPQNQELNPDWHIVHTYKRQRSIWVITAWLLLHLHQEVAKQKSLSCHGKTLRHFRFAGDA